MNDGRAASRLVACPRAQLPRLRFASADACAKKFNKTSRLIFALIIAVFAAARFWQLTAYGLFSDEVFSAETIHHSWHEMQRAIIADIVHPPLFYYLLKAWVTAGDSLLWMKLFPVLFSLLAIIPFVLLGCELKLRPLTINLALFLMAVNEYLVNYAQELRMYSLLLLLVTTSMWLFARLINAEGRALLVQLALFAANLLMVYTHYYGWLIVAGELLFLILRRRDRLWWFGGSIVLLVVGFFPWTFAVVEAAYDKGGLGPNLRWNTRPTATDFFQHYVTLNGPVYTSWRAYATVFSTVVFFAPILWWAWRCLREARPAKRSNQVESQPEATTEGRPCMNSGDVLLWLALLAVGPSLVAFTASYLIAQSVWGSRFLIVVAPAYLLLIAIAATTIELQVLRRVAVTLVAAWGALSGALQLTHRDKISWQPLVERMIQQTMKQSDDVQVYTRQGVVGTTVQYYLNQAGDGRLRVAYVDDFAEIDDAQFWIAFIRYGHDTGLRPDETFAGRGDALGEAIEARAPGHRVIFIPVRRDGNQREVPLSR